MNSGHNLYDILSGLPLPVFQPNVPGGRIVNKQPKKDDEPIALKKSQKNSIVDSAHNHGFNFLIHQSGPISDPQIFRDKRV